MLPSDERDLSRQMERAGCAIVNRRPHTWFAAPHRPGRPTTAFRLDCPDYVRDAIDEVARAHKVSAELIVGKSREHRIVVARHAAVRAVAKVVDWEPNQGNWAQTYWSATRIGRLFNRDHTSILYVLGTITAKRAK